MPETEKQEAQKTVVAFIAGLLIGGLLVWVFSSSPSPEAAPVDEEVNTEEVENNNSQTSRSNSSQTATASNADDNDTETSRSTNGSGVLEVNNQPAGTSVDLASVSFPTTEGWVIVRDSINGVPGRILGAARYHQEDGLIPESVNLLRATESGNTYEVAFYSENGDRIFDPSTDLILEDAATVTFTAQ